MCRALINYQPFVAIGLKAYNSVLARNRCMFQHNICICTPARIIVCQGVFALTLLCIGKLPMSMTCQIKCMDSSAQFAALVRRFFVPLDKILAGVSQPRQVQEIGKQPQLAVQQTWRVVAASPLLLVPAFADAVKRQPRFCQFPLALGHP